MAISNYLQLQNDVILKEWLTDILNRISIEITYTLIVFSVIIVFLVLVRALTNICLVLVWPICVFVVFLMVLPELRQLLEPILQSVIDAKTTKEITLVFDQIFH